MRVIRNWIERDYNVTRPHSSLDYATPSEFEEEFALASRVANE